MDDWTQKSIEGFDLLTVIAMVEACEPDLTMVRFLDLRRFSAHGAPPTEINVANASPLVTCLKCTMDGYQMFWKQDPRVALIEAARENRIVVLDIRLRHDGEACRRCQPTLSPLGDCKSQGELLCVRQK